MPRLNTPRLRQFRMPAEWEPHEATWLAWPHERSDWPGKFTPIPYVYGDIVRHLSQVEKVRILIEDEPAQERVRRLCERAGGLMANVEFFRCATNRSWTRDTCPTFVKSTKGRVAIVNWRFNGWAKYENHKADAAVGDFLAKRLDLVQWKPVCGNQRVVLEGGAIDVNGRGSLLTTEECLLSPDVQVRNPGCTKAEMEKIFWEYLGITNTLWLNRGVVGDDTHGHVDDLARFVNPSTVVVAVEEDKTDGNYEPTRENYQILRLMTDQRNRPLNVVKLPLPRPLIYDGQRLPASYANFYIANEIVLVPTFNDPADRVALHTLGKLFPEREVRGIHCLDLVLGLGTLHCMTQQQPARG